MNERRLHAWTRPACRLGLSMVEVTIAVAVVGVMLVAALETVSAARVTEYVTSQRGRGLLLARDLMSEILQQRFNDPAGSATSPIGAGADELAAGDRSLYDDVDDYHGWEALPPELKDGTPVAWATGYKREVTVDWVNVAFPSITAGSGTGVKRIVVTVKCDGRQVASLLAYRTTSWTDPVELQGSGS